MVTNLKIVFILIFFFKHRLCNDEEEFFKQLVLSKLELFVQENANLKKELNEQKRHSENLEAQIDNLRTEIRQNSKDLNETKSSIFTHNNLILGIKSDLENVEDYLKLIVPESCPIKECGYSYILEKCYFFNSVKMKWDAAQDNCTGRFLNGTGKLFEPQNKEISELVRQKQLKFMNSYNSDPDQHTWIGITGIFCFVFKSLYVYQDHHMSTTNVEF